MKKQVDKGVQNPGIGKEKIQALDLAISQIEKQFGKGSIMRLGGTGPIAKIPAISTGSISLDWALGVGSVIRHGPCPHRQRMRTSYLAPFENCEFVRLTPRVGRERRQLRIGFVPLAAARLETVLHME